MSSSPDRAAASPSIGMLAQKDGSVLAATRTDRAIRSGRSLKLRLPLASELRGALADGVAEGQVG